jgi:hypothetical protein
MDLALSGEAQGDAITAKLTVGLGSTSLFRADPDDPNSAEHVAGIERVLLARGTTKVGVSGSYGWTADVQIVKGEGSAGSERVDLDLSNVADDLIFEIRADGSVTVYQARMDFYGELEKVPDGHKLVVDRVHDLTGGSGNNVFRMLAGASLLGKLSGLLSSALMISA